MPPRVRPGRSVMRAMGGPLWVTLLLACGDSTTAHLGEIVRSTALAGAAGPEAARSCANASLGFDSVPDSVLVSELRAVHRTFAVDQAEVGDTAARLWFRYRLNDARMLGLAELRHHGREWELSRLSLNVVR